MPAIPFPHKFSQPRPFPHQFSPPRSGRPISSQTGLISPLPPPNSTTPALHPSAQFAEPPSLPPQQWPDCRLRWAVYRRVSSAPSRYASTSLSLSLSLSISLSLSLRTTNIAAIYPSLLLASRLPLDTTTVRSIRVPFFISSLFVDVDLSSVGWIAGSIVKQPPHILVKHHEFFCTTSKL
jgi:hypothetical protein